MVQHLHRSPISFLTFIVLSLLCTLAFFIFSRHRDTTSVTLKSSSSSSSSSFHDTFLSLAINSTLSHYLRTLTLHPHLAGTDQASRTADYVESHFKRLGLQTHTQHYQVLLSYPKHASLSAHFSGTGTREFDLGEPGQAESGVVRPYHAYSPSGSVRARAVFVNYGRDEDYRALGELGVRVEGCVVVVRRGYGTRSGVVKRVEQNGAVAVVMYTEGEERFRKGVERGTVMGGLGDPLSPGWASVVEGGERLGMKDDQVSRRFPRIPSMPVSAETAETILRSLEGPVLPQKWRDSLRTELGGVGPGPTVLDFTYQGEEKLAIIRDVFAVIRGSVEQDRYVLLGNHRDAWTYGAVDPNSGTAALLDIARRYSLLMHMGWRPRRTIVLCSWDAEEFGMIGSTEWVEQNLMHLSSKAVAYLNVDCAVQGPGLFIGASPQLDGILVEVTKKIKDPDVEGTTIFDQWTAVNKGIHILRLYGADSDFAPFLHHAGIPSVDIYYGKDFPVYHTAFDSYDWMISYGDPFFHRHAAVAGLWGLLALRLADEPILPFNYISYASELQASVSSLRGLLDGGASLEPLTESLQNFFAAAKEVEEVKNMRADDASTDLVELNRRIVNDRLMLAERGLLDVDGLHGMRWSRHIVYGPSEGSKLSMFPSITSILHESSQLTKEERDAMIQHEIWRVARAIQRATDALRGGLF